MPQIEDSYHSLHLEVYEQISRAEPSQKGLARPPQEAEQTPQPRCPTAWMGPGYTIKRGPSPRQVNPISASHPIISKLTVTCLKVALKSGVSLPLELHIRNFRVLPETGDGVS